MCPGFTNNLHVIDDAPKTAVIDKELARLNIDIACLQETCLADSDSIREAKYTLPPTATKSAPSQKNSSLTSLSSWVDRWVEHYLDLYATQNVVADAALDLAVLEELDALPTVEKLGKAIECLPCGKAPGKDGRC